MNKIAQIIRDLEGEVRNQKARCILPSDGGRTEESTLMGTRDGYLRLAIALLEMLQNTETENGEHDPITGAWWDDRIKDCLLQLPNSDAWIVGAYLFKTDKDMMDQLAKFTEWDGATIHSIKNDPDFIVEPPALADGVPPPAKP